MKRIVRLTESDLVKLINRVIKEQVSGPQPQEVVKECFMQHINLKDLAKIPTCSAIAMEIMTTKKLPTDLGKGMKCANEMASAIGSDPFEAFSKLTQIGDCILKKPKPMY